MANENAEAALLAAMELSLRQYDAGDTAWFDHLDDEVTVYGIGATEPVLGRKAYEESFSPVLSVTKRKTRVVQQQVRSLTSDTALVTQTLRIIQKNIASVVRQSVIWVMKQNEWRMMHLHSALVGTPSGTTTAPITTKGIRVLNERIATVAAVLGVAQ
jgi:hypothetical protein